MLAATLRLIATALIAGVAGGYAVHWVNDQNTTTEVESLSRQVGQLHDEIERNWQVLRSVQTALDEGPQGTEESAEKIDALQAQLFSVQDDIDVRLKTLRDQLLTQNAQHLTLRDRVADELNSLREQRTTLSYIANEITQLRDALSPQ